MELNATSQILPVFIRDSTTGNGKTGLVAADMSGQFVGSDNSGKVALSFVDGLVGDAYSAGKWAEEGGGDYLYHYPNAAWAGLRTVKFTFSAAGCIDATPSADVIADNIYLPLTEVVTAGGISLKRITAYGLSNVVRAPSDVWQWDGSTAVSAPGFFRVKLNNADYNLATIMSIYQDSATGISNEYIFGAIEVNDVINLFNRTTMESKRLRVNGPPTDNGVWWEFPVISGDGFSGPWSTNDVIVVSFENVILTHLETMDAKLGTADDLGTGDNLFANNRDMAGTTFDNTTDSLEDIIDTGGPGPWTTGGGGSGTKHFSYMFSTDTDTGINPAASSLKVNNANINLATEVLISKTSDTEIIARTLLDMAAGDTITIDEKDDPEQAWTFTVASVADQTRAVLVTGTIEGTGSTPADNADLQVRFPDASLAKQDTIISTGGSGPWTTGGGAGGSEVIVTPIVNVIPEPVQGATLKSYIDQTPTFTIAPLDANLNPIDPTKLEIEVIIETSDKVDSEIIADGQISKTETSYTFTPQSSNGDTRQRIWATRIVGSGDPIGQGPYVVQYIASGDG